ncbi:MAG: hypothetical protein WDO06_01320 [Actinomycetota bacterium]
MLIFPRSAVKSIQASAMVRAGAKNFHRSYWRWLPRAILDRQSIKNQF